MSLRIGIIGGSGLGEALIEAMNPDDLHIVNPDTPFGTPSSSIVLGTVRGIRVALLKRHGIGHRLSPSRVPYRANIYALKTIGCTHVIASGACGSLRAEIHPGELVVCDQIIDQTDGRPRSFFEHSAVHIDFADPFCPVTREWLMLASEQLDGQRVHPRGTYVCIEGPSFSTRAEALMHRGMGADVVGMTALPEARLAREAELPYALIALPTDDDCWRPRASGQDTSSMTTHIRANLGRAVRSSVDLIHAALGDVSLLREKESPATTALTDAIWSNHDLLDPDEVEQLAILWKHRLRRQMETEGD